MSVVCQDHASANKSMCHQFNYDYVFDMQTQQEEIFSVAAKPVLYSILEGFNGTILAYGQTSSGKTYTMTGDLQNTINNGIIPRMVKHLFESINNSSETIEFAVKLSMVEIYMEKIRDLLDPTKTNLKVHEDKVKGIILDNCTESFAVAEEEILKLLVRGNENRTIGVTDMNFQSSRSHVIVMLTVKMNDTKECFAKTGKLYLVDLAGSEKPSKNSSQDQTLVEAKMINKSLSTLGRVIYSLTDNSSTYIPYRDSKLTRLLQDSLGGNSKTCLIITASPSILSVDETLSTCRFGVTANTITNNAKINKEYTLAELKTFLQTLEGELESKSQLISLYSSILQEHSIEVPIDFNSKIGSERSSMMIIKYNAPYNTKQREHLSNCNITQALLVNIPENNKNRQHQSLMREHTGNKINIGTPPKKEGVSNKIKQDQKLHEQINNSVNQIIDFKKTEIQPTNIKTNEEVTQHIAIENKDTSTQGSAWRNYHSNSTFITTNTETIHECNEITKENCYLASKSKEGMYNTCFMVDYATNTEIAEYSAHFLFTINELEEKAKSEREKFTSEKLIILTQMKDHQMRIKKLEEELQTYSAKVKNLDDILNEDQDSCKKKAVNLEKQLETLTFLFHQLTNNTSSLKTEKQILEKKLEIKQIQLKECEEQNSNMRQQLSKKMLLIEEYKDRLGVDKIMKDKALNNQNVQIIKTILGGKKNKGTFENIEANPGEPGI